MEREIYIRRPTPPSEFIRDEILSAYALTQDQLAKRLGVSRLTINELVNDRRSITPDMALRFSRLTGQSPEYWLNLQIRLDLWEAAQNSKRALEEIEPLKESDLTGIGGDDSARE